MSKSPSTPTLFLLPTMSGAPLLTGPAPTDVEAEEKKKKGKKGKNEFILTRDDEMNRVVRRAAAKTMARTHQVTARRRTPPLDSLACTVISAIRRAGEGTLG